MKNKIFLISLFVSCIAYSQNFNYAGTYKYGTTPEEGKTGIIHVYPNSDSTLLFYIELNRGAPSYNSGAMVGEMNIYSAGEADFTIDKKDDIVHCSLNFWFHNDSLFIRSNDDVDNCGYGYGVYSDGDFSKTSSLSPEFFIDRYGNKTWFKDLKWQKWWEE